MPFLLNQQQALEHEIFEKKQGEPHGNGMASGDPRGLGPSPGSDSAQDGHFHLNAAECELSGGQQNRDPFGGCAFRFFSESAS